jgi:hypothetical protein
MIGVDEMSSLQSFKTATIKISGFEIDDWNYKTMNGLRPIRFAQGKLHSISIEVVSLVSKKLVVWQS